MPNNDIRKRDVYDMPRASVVPCGIRQLGLVIMPFLSMALSSPEKFIALDDKLD